MLSVIILSACSSESAQVDEVETTNLEKPEINSETNTYDYEEASEELVNVLTEFNNQVSGANRNYFGKYNITDGDNGTTNISVYYNTYDFEFIHDGSQGNFEASFTIDENENISDYESNDSTVIQDDLPTFSDLQTLFDNISYVDPSVLLNIEEDTSSFTFLYENQMGGSFYNVILAKDGTEIEVHYDDDANLHLNASITLD